MIWSAPVRDGSIVVEYATNFYRWIFLNHFLGLRVADRVVAGTLRPIRKRPTLGKLRIDAPLPLDGPPVVAVEFLAKLDDLRDGRQPLGLTRQSLHRITDRVDNLDGVVRQYGDYGRDVNLGIVGVTRSIAAEEEACVFRRLPQVRWPRVWRGLVGDRCPELFHAVRPSLKMRA
jgi:hypothetical protein